MKITMIGHSTVLIETAGFRILTDPYFGLRGNLAYSRPLPPGRTREELLDVDLVLLSHNHFDHTDSKYFHALAKTIPIFAPSVTAWVTRLKGGNSVIGMRTWERRDFGGVSITAVPAWHTTVTHGYILEAEGRRIYFAGDTYFAPFMQRLARDFKPEVAIMPVTTFRVPLTMGEKGALKATRLLGPEVIIPIHMGITPRSPLLRTSQTPEHFEQRLRQAGMGTDVVVLREGESWVAGAGRETEAAASVLVHAAGGSRR